MGSEFNHDRCRQVKVRRQRHNGPFAHPSAEGSRTLFDGYGEVRSLDHIYSFMNPRFMLEICNGLYEDGTARHTQIEMEGASAHLYGEGSWVEGFVRGDGTGDFDDKSPEYYKETWYFDTSGTLSRQPVEESDEELTYK